MVLYIIKKITVYCGLYAVVKSLGGTILASITGTGDLSKTVSGTSNVTVTTVLSFLNDLYVMPYRSSLNSSLSSFSWATSCEPLIAMLDLLSIMRCALTFIRISLFPISII